MLPRTLVSFTVVGIVVVAVVAAVFLGAFRCRCGEGCDCGASCAEHATLP